MCGKHLKSKPLVHQTSKFSKDFEAKVFQLLHPYTAAQLHTRDPQELEEFVITQAAKLKVLIDSIREVEANSRGDYKELLDLMKAYFGLNEGRFQFLGCGAVQNCYKMAMLQEYIPPGIASKSQLQKISRFVDFCSFVFNLQWFNYFFAASVPHQDLELVNIKNFVLTLL